MELERLKSDQRECFILIPFQPQRFSVSNEIISTITKQYIESDFLALNKDNYIPCSWHRGRRKILL